MSVKIVHRAVYYSARRGRHFMTARGAAMAEANAVMYERYPTESAEYEDEFGRCTYPGFHFSEDAHLVAVRDRLVKRYMAKLKRLST